MVINGTYAKKKSNVNAKMAGEVSTATVRLIQRDPPEKTAEMYASVCQADDACKNFPLAGGVSSLDTDITANMTFYSGGETVFSNPQFCGVTNRKILDMLSDRPPQVTFSCDASDATCDFQFWTSQVESSIELRVIARPRFSPAIQRSTNVKTLSAAAYPTGLFVAKTAVLNVKEESACIILKSRPVKPDNTRWVALSIAGAGCFIVFTSAVIWYAGHARKSDFSKIRLPDDESSRSMTDHVPASLHFHDVTYKLVMAITGPSGTGKSTFLDILLARKRKRGAVTGTTLVNSREVGNEQFRKVVGDMSLEAKTYRMLETMNELGILDIKDMRIGDSGRQSISGGEQRRVSIACRLVTSPSILFLDEPTSRLDAYNAFNVVESLPRSNLVALFNQFVLLAQGKLVYSGEFPKCQDYFSSIGQPGPPSFNIAGFLIDLTMRANLETRSAQGLPFETASPVDNLNLGDERELLMPTPHHPASIHTIADDETVLQIRPSPDNSSDGFKSSDMPLSLCLIALVDNYDVADGSRGRSWWWQGRA
ncbi:hypothetical protein EW146_g5317 [Bondarzewia mesenterica]|uniref:ABC transporter domain-containing protein n=1 Tax=Bondarzewia mesenterica TaxID=1095465 RepID=A0A4S4LXP2_9AGAM|nr:hypothetical protein EW146_g5317 [Bondarzewia mesenterica]